MSSLPVLLKLMVDPRLEFRESVESGEETPDAENDEAASRLDVELALPKDAEDVEVPFDAEENVVEFRAASEAVERAVNDREEAADDEVTLCTYFEEADTAVDDGEDADAVTVSEVLDTPSPAAI